jgi:hypothetical protein
MRYLLKKKVGRKFVDVKEVTLRADLPLGSAAVIATEDEMAGHLDYVFDNMKGTLEVGYFDEVEGRERILYKLEAL